MTVALQKAGINSITPSIPALSAAAVKAVTFLFVCSFISLPKLTVIPQSPHGINFAFIV